MHVYRPTVRTEYIDITPYIPWTFASTKPLSKSAKQRNPTANVAKSNKNATIADKLLVHVLRYILASLTKGCQSRPHGDILFTRVRVVEADELVD